MCAWIGQLAACMAMRLFSAAGQACCHAVQSHPSNSPLTPGPHREELMALEPGMATGAVKGRGGCCWMGEVELGQDTPGEPWWNFWERSLRLKPKSGPCSADGGALPLLGFCPMDYLHATSSLTHLSLLGTTLICGQEVNLFGAVPLSVSQQVQTLFHLLKTNKNLTNKKEGVLGERAALLFGWRLCLREELVWGRLGSWSSA